MDVGDARRIPSGCWRTHTGARETFLRDLVDRLCGAREEQVAEGLATRLPWAWRPCSRCGGPCTGAT